jgi:hypothetical protein
MIDFMFLFRASMCCGDLARYQLCIGMMDGNERDEMYVCLL